MPPAAAPNALRIAVLGTGRMARAVEEAAATQSDLAIMALVGPSEPDWDTVAGWCASLEDVPDTPDLLIDFSLPEGTAVAAPWCGERGVPLVSGVTGLPDGVRAALRQAADRVAVLWSANLSLGVNLLADLVARAASVLDATTPVLIEDIHHQWKKDAPSGTALMLGEVIAGQRDGVDGAVDYHSRREGEVIGEHTVTFRMAGEEISLVHQARNRSIYASGALQAGRWLLAQPPGLYAPGDWLAGR